MQVFTKRVLIAFLVAFLGITIASCNKDETTDGDSPNNSTIPQISNPDGVFISNDDYDITYSDLYEELKDNDGLNQLLIMVDNDLLSSYVDAVTDTEIANKRLELTYGTYDQEEIDEYTAEEQSEMETTYNQTMALLGYKTVELEEEYISLQVARDNYAISQMLSEDNSEESWYAGPTGVADYYVENNNPDIVSIKIQFSSKAEANEILRSYSLVSGTNELLLYTGTNPIDEVIVDETNSRSLTDEEVLEYFLTMYNLMYSGYKDEIAVDSTLTSLLANEDLLLTYDEIEALNASLPTLMYDTLGSYEDYKDGSDSTLYYTYEPFRYDTSSNETAYYLVLNLAKFEETDLEDFDGTEADLVAIIGQDLYDEYEQEIIQDTLDSSSFVSNILVQLRQDNSFDIYDYYLGKDYTSIDSDFEINETGSETVVASYGDVEITADDLFSFAFENNSTMYAIYAAQTKALVAAHFADLYCTDGETCEYDVSSNTSDLMEEHRSTLAQVESDFDESFYATYYTFAEYLYLAYGVSNTDDMLFDYYVMSSLQPLLIYDEIVDSDYAILNELLSLSQPYYDNYFSLDVNHLLIYVDRDQDGSPDDYEEFYEDLEDQAAYDALIADFEAAIRLYLDVEDNTMSTLEEEYAEADRDDAIWGDYVSYGFELSYEELGETTYNDALETYVSPFVDALVEVYQNYTLEENVELESYLADQLYETVYGLHLILAEPGTDFEQPSAKFEMTYDDDENPEYLAGLVNANDELTFEQVKIYADYRFYEIASDYADLEELYGLEQPDMPEELLEAIDYYFADLYDATYVIGYLNQIIVDQLTVSNYVNEDSTYLSLTQAEFNANMAAVSEVYSVQIYQDLDYRELD